ncbi:hypothetical protein AJ80_01563 [Polytolypa hystricis UAMH7299]|uniref:BZIP domain-containing protein n=1 Tax=Polytolypa hystricis (strain UAMH7299) TaxID=1447883 RepID=A0A2B7Z1T9_POLH7|nr:hypothetical protein AJ80_01563 [Polytolypa hystricis UAMH7299]
MARYSQPPTFDFYHQSPSALDAKTVFSGDDDMSVLDDKILDSNTDLSAMSDPRRSSFDQAASTSTSTDDFSRRESVWSDMARHNNPDSQSHHTSQLSTPLFEPATANFVRLDTAQSASYGQQQSWPLSADSGSCTPTPIYEQFSHDYDGSATNPFAGGAVGPVNPMSFPQIPYRPGSTFPPSRNAVAMSPQSSQQGWISASSEAPEPVGSKPMRNPTYRNGSALHMRRDGIRKKNARFEIPAERTLSNIDILIAQSTDEDEIKELKQQKRLLRNRQAALDSRQRKKVHTEKLEEDKKRSTSLITELQDALSEMKRREGDLHREKAELLDRQQQLHQYIEQLHMEKSEMIRTHTLETGELRKKNSILREHAEKLELNARPSAFRNEFSDYENISMDATWEDYSMVNDFSLDTEPQPVTTQAPTPTPEDPLLLVSKKAEKQLEKASNGEFPFSWNAFYMCLLFGAFVASNSASVTAPAIPHLSEEYRAESANVLKAVLASAAPSEASQSINLGVIPGPSSATNALPTTISGAEMAQITGGHGPITSTLDDLHRNLVAPTKEQEEQEVFALSTEQYRALTTLDDDDGDANAKAPPSNLQQAYAAMRNTGMQNRANAKHASDIYSRSLLWDRVPEKVVRDFQRMVRECSAASGIKAEGTGDMCQP